MYQFSGFFGAVASDEVSAFGAGFRSWCSVCAGGILAGLVGVGGIGCQDLFGF